MTDRDILEAIFSKIKSDPESITGLTEQDRIELDDFRFFLDASCWCLDPKDVKSTPRGIKYIFRATCSPDERWGTGTTATVLTNQRKTKVLSVDINFKVE